MSKDILDEMTKEEILYWIRSSAYFCIKPPSKSELMSARYFFRSKKIQDRREEHTRSLEKIDCKKRDELAKAFNSETDIHKRIAILDKMKPYELAFKKWFSENKIIRADEIKLEKYYEEIERQREIEHPKSR